jgi:NAD(P)-dependent dehydrogenase (short-subunit alcohol dehydrogenase family)
MMANTTQNDLKGKICLVTGATLGIGKETALGLAKQGATVIMVGRDASRTREAAEWVKQGSGNDKVDTMLADLSLQAEVRKLAAAFKAKYDQLHVLVNNAGAIFEKREVTAEGFERTWALNHLAYFLLTHELLDLLKASAPARIVNVSSDAHRGMELRFDNLQGEKRYSYMFAYGQSKLANVMFTYALTRRLQGTGVTANCLHPGVVATGFGKNTPGVFKILVTLAKPFLLTPEKGAATSIYLASSPEAANISGKYFEKGRAVPSDRPSYDEAVQERLWEVSLQQTGLKEVISKQ